jgi:Fe-Mn family superoxide dismutase
VFTLPNLPYGYDALAPSISERTLRHHHDKHHAKYVDTTNLLLKDKPELGSAALEQVIAAARDGKQTKLFNNAAQAWNHGFLWESMAPGGQAPEGELAEAIKAAFGDVEGLKTAFVTEGVGHFASGWAWLVAEAGKLRVMSTHDAETVADHDVVPLLVADVWEHAYYLDYQQDREAFLRTAFDTVTNWRFAEAQFKAAGDEGRGAYRFPSPHQKAA